MLKFDGGPSGIAGKDFLPSDINVDFDRQEILTTEGGGGMGPGVTFGPQPTGNHEIETQHPPVPTGGTNAIEQGGDPKAVGTQKDFPKQFGNDV